MAAGDERRKRALVMSRVSRVRRSLDAQVLARALPGPLWAAATAFLVWRVAVQRHAALAGAAFLAAALVAGWALFARRRPTQTEAAVVADRLAGAQGLLLTRLEVPVGAWELGLNELLRHVPAPRLEVRRSVALSLLALAFWAVAAWVPLPQRVGVPRNAAAETRLEELAQKLEAVAREEPLGDAAQDVLDDLRRDLEDGRFDAADWEAADALEAELDKKALEAEAELSRAAEAARGFEAALAQGASGEAQARQREALESALLAMSDGQARSGSDALEQLLSQAGQGGQAAQGGGAGQSGAQSGQSQSGAQSGKQGEGSGSAQAEAVRRALVQRQQQLARGMGGQSQQQRSSRTSSGQRSAQRQSGQGQGPGEGQGEAQQQGQGQGQGQGHASRQASAGAGHGPGEGELVFGAQAEMDPERLAFAPLPEGQGGEAGELWGLQRADPRRPSALAHPASGSGAAAAGQAAPANREGELLPKNRALIQRYFDAQR